jgi:hypothetical protein
VFCYLIMNMNAYSLLLVVSVHQGMEWYCNFTSPLILRVSAACKILPHVMPDIACHSAAIFHFLSIRLFHDLNLSCCCFSSLSSDKRRTE